MPIYDFSCPQGHTTERRTEYGLAAILCPACGQPAERECVYTDQYIFGETCAQNHRRAEVPLNERRYKNFPLFQEASQEIAYAAEKGEKETGQKVKTPAYSRIALKRAKRIKAGK